MEHFLNDHKDHPNQPEKSHKLYDETGHLVLSLMESQWKLRRQHDQNFPMEGNPLQNKFQHQKIEINPKELDCESFSQGSKQES